MSTAEPRRVERLPRRPNPPGSIYIGPGSEFAMPWPIGPARAVTTMPRAIWLYGLLIDPAARVGLPSIPTEVTRWDAKFKLVRLRLHVLRGHDLSCYCRLGAACHGDALLRVANRGEL